MNILITYYAFLVAGPVWLAVVRESPMVSHKRSVYLGYILAPPLLLVLQTLNLSFLLGVVLLVPGLLVINRLSRLQADQPTTPTTLWLWLGIWLTEAVLPLSLHFALRARPELERISLLIAGLTLLAGTLLTFLVLAPDLRKRA
jgi:hypothetical protein